MHEIRVQFLAVHNARLADKFNKLYQAQPLHFLASGVRQWVVKVEHCAALLELVHQ